MLGKVWIGLGVTLILFGYAATLVMRGFGALQELLSPSNVANYIAVAVTLGPGVLLLMAAQSLEKGQRKAGLMKLALVPVALAIVVGLVVLFFSERSSRKTAQNDDRAREYKATAVRVKNGSATMLEHKRNWLTKTSGPVGKEGIPEVIKLGDEVMVSGRKIRVQHIFVSEYNAEMKWGKEVLARKGGRDLHTSRDRERPTKR